jgi:hypothetical protein
MFISSTLLLIVENKKSHFYLAQTTRKIAYLSGSIFGDEKPPQSSREQDQISDQ